MVKGMKLLFVLFILALTIAFISAETTTITVKTDNLYSTYKITLGVWTTNCELLPDQLLENTTNPETGETTFTYSGSQSKITFHTHVTLGATIIKTKGCGSYLNYSSGTSPTINALDEIISTPIVNTSITPTNSTDSTNLTDSVDSVAVPDSTNDTLIQNLTTTSSITGGAVTTSEGTTDNATQIVKETLGEKIGNLWNSVAMYVYYVLGAIALLLIIYFIIVQIRKAKSGEHPSYFGKKTHSSEDILVTKDPRIERELGEAQRKIKEAQDVIDRISHRENHLADAEKKFEEAKKELERAKRGL